MKTEDWVIYRPYTNQEDFEHAVRLWEQYIESLFPKTVGSLTLRRTQGEFLMRYVPRKVAMFTFHEPQLDFPVNITLDPL